METRAARRRRPWELLHQRHPDAPSRSAALGRSRGAGGAALAAAALVLSGCAGLEPGGDGDQPSPTASDEPEGAVDAGPLLQVEQRGGFAPVGTDFAGVPQLTVYPDGQAIVHGPQIAIYPPPALPNLLVRELDGDGVDALVELAQEADLLGEVPDYGTPDVADAPTTVVTLRVEGEAYVHAGEALGISDGTAPQDSARTEEPLPGDESQIGLDEEERALRAALQEFIQAANELVGSATEVGPYEIDAFAAMARPAPPDGAEPATTEEPGEPPTTQEPGAEPTEPSLPVEGDQGEGSADAAEPEMEIQVLPWPLDLALADAEQCVVVDGDAAATLEEVLAGANRLTRFEQDGTVYDVWARPLLPHEEECPSED